MKLPAYMQSTQKGLAAEIRLDSPRAIFTLALDVARFGSFSAWWHRPWAFVAVVWWGLHEISRGPA